MFNIIDPIPIKTEEPLNEKTLEELIRTHHLSDTERKELIKVIIENQHVLLKCNEKLTATTA